MNSWSAWTETEFRSAVHRFPFVPDSLEALALYDPAALSSPSGS